MLPRADRVIAKLHMQGVGLAQMLFMLDVCAIVDCLIEEVNWRENASG
jgi:hypothetical protein